MNTTETVKVIIGDDHAVFREGLKQVIKKAPHLKIVGEAENGKQLVELYKKSGADIILTDILMPEMDGIQATKQIIELDPGAKIIALSMFDQERTVVEIMEAGAKGYLIKNAGKKEILEAIEEVCNGRTYISNAISYNLIRLISQSRFNTKKDEQVIEFSPAEKEIILYTCQELSSKDIAEKMNLSARTIEGHRSAIMDKIGVKSKVGVVIYAIRNGLYE